MADADEQSLLTDNNKTFPICVSPDNVGENGYKCTNPSYQERFDNSLESSTWPSGNNTDLDSHGIFEVGGEGCDAEDKGITAFIPLTDNASKRFLPKLVFIESGDVPDDKNENHLDDQCYAAKSTPVSLQADCQGGPVDHRLTLFGKFDKSVDSSLSQRLVTSQNSSDSDLITEHSEEMNMVSNGDTQPLIPGNAEEFHDEWHCHNKNVHLPSDKTARNQLLAVSVLCFLFMVGESVGKKKFIKNT